WKECPQARLGDELEGEALRRNPGDLDSTASRLSANGNETHVTANSMLAKTRQPVRGHGANTTSDTAILRSARSADARANPAAHRVSPHHPFKRVGLSAEKPLIAFQQVGSWYLPTVRG